MATVVAHLVQSSPAWFLAPMQVTSDVAHGVPGTVREKGQDPPLLKRHALSLQRGRDAPRHPMLRTAEGFSKPPASSCGHCTSPDLRTSVSSRIDPCSRKYPEAF